MNSYQMPHIAITPMLTLKLVGRTRAVTCRDTRWDFWVSCCLRQYFLCCVKYTVTTRSEKEINKCLVWVDIVVNVIIKWFSS